MSKPQPKGWGYKYLCNWVGASRPTHYLWDLISFAKRGFSEKQLIHPRN
jgi:hypothetical protein